MRSLAAETPGLAQLIAPPSSPTITPTPPPPPPPTPTIGAAPAALSFSAVQNGTAPTAQSISISNVGTGTFAWSAVSNMPWLKVNGAATTTGTNAGAVSVGVVPSGLTAGTYTGAITITSTGATNNPLSISVTLVLTPAPTPTIGLTPATLSFSAVQNGTNPVGQSVTVNNTGAGTLTWSASTTTPWLKLNGTSTSSGTNSGTFSVSVNNTGLAAGSYNGTIALAATGASNTPQNIPVTLTITAAPTPTIQLSSTSLSFTALQGGASPATQQVGITNSGAGTLTWSATKIGTANWLSISPTSGTGAGTIAVSVNPTGLTSGTVSAQFSVAATGATNTPQVVTVSLNVTASPTIGLSPTSLSFTATQGGSNPAAKTFTVSNSGGGTLNWSVSPNATWLTVTPASGSVTTQSATITAAPNIAGMTAGPYSATITVSGTGSTAQTVSVSLSIAAAATGSATITWTPVIDSNLAGYKIYRATTSGGYGTQPLITLPANVSSYVDTGLASGTTYFYVITAFDTSGNESGRSTEVHKSF